MYAIVCIYKQVSNKTATSPIEKYEHIHTNIHETSKPIRSFAIALELHALIKHAKH